MNACHRCANLRREEESWEMPHIWWWECAYKEGMANLKSFPFRNTTCKGFTPIDISKKHGIVQLLDLNEHKGV